MSLVCDYHDNQVFSGRSQRFQRLRLIRGSLVVKCGPPDVKLPGPVDGPGSVDVVIVLLRFQGCAEKTGQIFQTSLLWVSFRWFPSFPGRNPRGGGVHGKGGVHTPVSNLHGDIKIITSLWFCLVILVFKCGLKLPPPALFLVLFTV